MSQKAKGLDFPSQTPHPAEAELSPSLAQAQNTAERKKEKKKRKRLKCTDGSSKMLTAHFKWLPNLPEPPGRGRRGQLLAARRSPGPPPPSPATPCCRQPHSASLHPHACCQSPMKRGDILRKNSNNNKAMRGCWPRRGEKSQSHQHSSWTAKASRARAGPQDTYDCTAAMVNDHPRR